jgi:hypothetical protein
VLICVLTLFMTTTLCKAVMVMIPSEFCNEMSLCESSTRMGDLLESVVWGSQKQTILYVIWGGVLQKLYYTPQSTSTSRSSSSTSSRVLPTWRKLLQTSGSIQRELRNFESCAHSLVSSSLTIASTLLGSTEIPRHHMPEKGYLIQPEFTLLKLNVEPLLPQNLKYGP